MPDVRITEEQERKIPLYLEKWMTVMTDTSRLNREKAIEAAQALYQYACMPFPSQVFFVDNPIELARKSAQLVHGTDSPTVEQVVEETSKIFFGRTEAFWTAYYDFANEEAPGQPDAAMVDVLKSLTQNTGGIIMLDEAVVISEPPTQVLLDEHRRLSNLNGPALTYASNPEDRPLNLYMFDGIRYDSFAEMLMSLQAEKSASEASK